MSDQDDPLSGEVSVQVHMDETGLKVAAKSRAAVAFDRLWGSAIDIFGAPLEGKARRIRARDAIQEDLIRIEGEAAKEKLLADPSAGDRVLEVFHAEQSRKQFNRDAVALEALAELESMPPTEEEEQDPASIEDDWLNVFSAHAENASSDHLRKIWGQILAGEIRKPKSFSLTTLRFISVLDQEIAEIFQKAVKTRLRVGMLPKQSGLSGKALLDLTFLEEEGLLQEVNGTLGWDLDADENGYFLIGNGDRILRIKLPKKQELRLPLIKITRVGVEIASILPTENDEVGLRAIAEIFEEEAESLELLSVVARPAEGPAECRIIERIK